MRSVKSILLLIGLAGLMLLAGCASTPHFKPSVPVEEAQSLEESLVLCNEYELPQEKDSSRPVSLRPYLDCLNEAAKQHSTRGNTAFLVFDEELELVYSLLQEHQWTSRLALELEVGIHAALRTLWRNKLSLSKERYTQDEKDAVLKHFPKTAQVLEATRWRVAAAVDLDPGLEKLIAGVSSLRTRDIRAAKWDQEIPSSLCKDYLRLRSEVDYLSALWEDQRDMQKVAPKSWVSHSLRKRYSRRIELAENELNALKSKVPEYFDAQGCLN